MLDDDLLAKLKRKDWRDPELERQMVNEEIRTAKDLMLLADDDFKSRPKVHARKMHLLQVQSFQGGPRQENNLYSECTETGTKTRKVQDKALTQKLNSDQQQIELQEVLLPSVP